MPNVTSIPPGAPFLSVLVDRLLSGDLIHGFGPDLDPLALANVTIWLPTRRAVRELSSEFVSRLNTGSTLLPDIRALGDSEDDDLIPLGSADNKSQPVGSVDRQLILGQLIHAWARNLNDDQRSLYEGAEILMPSSLGDAIWFASDLARLMDTVATEEADWSLLANLVPEELTDWWQLTLEFLKISTKAWPEYLEERGLCDLSEFRIRSIRYQAQSYRDRGSRGPVIAAGSTGSIPATADLLRTIANLEQGLVVLPGLDRDLDPETWAKIDLPDNEQDDFGTAPGHPQFGLKRLLDFMHVSHGDVHHIAWTADDGSGPARVREHLVSAAMRPSHSTEKWQDFLKLYSDEQRKTALSNVALVEASSERHEAMAIALALRETLEDKTKTAALVTPDRNLARRVAVELERFGLEADDSAGSDLRNSQQGQLLQLVVQVAWAPTVPLALVSLMKHPLARFGMSLQQCARAAHALELALFRGSPGSIEPTQLPARLELAREQATEKKSHTPPSIMRLNDTDWDLAAALARTLAKIFDECGSSVLAVKDLAHLTIEKLEACGQSEEDLLDNIYGQEFGRALNQFLGELLESDSSLMSPVNQWPTIVDALLSNRMVRTQRRTHPRLAILGPLEARLQQFDRVVLGGLNEKVWPATTRNDPFLSRPQKAELSLPPPERRTGLAAHDFQMLMGINDVVLTRSQKLDNAPSVASRWVQRLCLLAGEPTVETIRRNGQRFLDWVDQIDQPEGPVRSTGQPAPCPPVANRPTSLSITEIQNWIEDPYVIYARHILKLSALGPVVYESGSRERGTFYHEILEQYSGSQSDSLDQLLEIARGKFDHSDVRADQRNLWWIRFQEIAKDFNKWDVQQRTKTSQSFIESYGKLALKHGFVLRGKADRIDAMQDGSVEIIDYKTGKYPSIGSVNKLDSPQLPLEAAMVMDGSFDGIDALDVKDLTYIRLRPNGEFSVEPVSASRQAKSVQQLAEGAIDKLTQQIEAYRDPKKAYVSKARPIRDEPWQGDYDHLARVREWSIAGEGDEE